MDKNKLKNISAKTITRNQVKSAGQNELIPAPKNMPTPGKMVQPKRRAGILENARKGNHLPNNYKEKAAGKGKPGYSSLKNAALKRLGAH